MTYRVIAPYVTLRVRDQVGSEVLVGFYKDSPVPESVNQEDLERHIRKGMVEEMGKAETKELEKIEAEAKKAEEDAAKAADEKAKADAEAAAKAAAEAAKPKPKA